MFFQAKFNIVDLANPNATFVEDLTKESSNFIIKEKSKVFNPILLEDINTKLILEQDKMDVNKF